MHNLVNRSEVTAMQYTSVKEYFYKLYSRLFLLVLIPLTAFVLIYRGIQSDAIGSPLAGDVKAVEMVRFIFLGVAVLDWVMATFYFQKTLKPARTLVSLGERLDRYCVITLTRFVIIVSGLLVLAVGFYLLEDQVLTIAFMAGLALLGFIWPFPFRVSRHLKLKGDEKNWVQNWK